MGRDSAPARQAIGKDPDAVASAIASIVAVFNSPCSEVGTRVEATVAGAEAPGSSLAANDGTVEDVLDTDSEGPL